MQSDEHDGKQALSKAPFVLIGGFGMRRFS
jgi:hypothetical protein